MLEPIAPIAPRPCWYNGTLYPTGEFPIAANDPGLMFGATVFSTLRVYGEDLADRRTAWAHHRQRLAGSIAALGWQTPDWETIEQGLHTLKPYYAVLRVTLFPQGQALVSGREVPTDLATLQTAGIIAWLAPFAHYQRNLAGHKTGNYLGAWSALQTAQRLGAREAILTDRAGTWLETATGNLWGYRTADRCWFTPPLDGSILPGIVRSRLIAALHDHDCAIDEQTRWTTDFVQTLDGLAYSNCGVEIVPIVRVIMGEGSTGQGVTETAPTGETLTDMKTGQDDRLTGIPTDINSETTIGIDPELADTTATETPLQTWLVKPRSLHSDWLTPLRAIFS